MCQNSSLEILSKTPNGYVGKCTGCEKYNVVFENIFLLLTEQEMYAISHVIDENLGVWVLEQYIGKGKKVVMQTPLSNMYFAFTYQEYEDLKCLINETILVLEARNFLRQPLNQN